MSDTKWNHPILKEIDDKFIQIDMDLSLISKRRKQNERRMRWYRYVAKRWKETAMAWMNGGRGW